MAGAQARARSRRIRSRRRTRRDRRPLGRDGPASSRPSRLRLHDLLRRVAIEKNLEAFLGLDLPGSKIVVGAGPDLAALAKRFPAAHFMGYRFGEELARCFSSDVPGPLDVLEPCVTGMLDDDLGAAAKAALALDRAACRAAALERSWSHSASLFLSHLVGIRTGAALCSASTAPRVSPSRAE